MLKVALILLCLIAAPAAAQSVMSAESFDSYTRGKTLFYGFNGTSYGAERYLDGRRVIWSFLDGVCKEGVWYEENGQICFVYHDLPTPQCWTFSKGAGRLIARFENDPTDIELYEAEDTGQEMLCHGPEVGV